MAETTPTKRMSPLAIIILVLVAVLAVIFFMNWRGTQHTPSGVAMPAKDKAGVMPAQATAPPQQQPASDMPSGKARDSRPNSPNEEGGLQTTGGGIAPSNVGTAR